MGFAMIFFLFCSHFYVAEGLNMECEIIFCKPQ